MKRHLNALLWWCTVARKLSRPVKCWIYWKEADKCKAQEQEQRWRRRRRWTMFKMCCRLKFETECNDVEWMVRNTAISSVLDSKNRSKFFGFLRCCCRCRCRFILISRKWFYQHFCVCVRRTFVIIAMTIDPDEIVGCFCMILINLFGSNSNCAVCGKWRILFYVFFFSSSFSRERINELNVFFFGNFSHVK